MSAKYISSKTPFITQMLNMRQSTINNEASC